MLTRGQRPEDIAGVDGFLECFDGRRFQTQRPRLPPGDVVRLALGRLPRATPGATRGRADVAGLFRFPATTFDRLGATPALRRYTRRDGLSSDMIYRLFEDSRGDLWIGLADRTLARWDRRSDRIRSFSPADGLPGFRWHLAGGRGRRGLDRLLRRRSRAPPRRPARALRREGRPAPGLDPRPPRRSGRPPLDRDEPRGPRAGGPDGGGRPAVSALRSGAGAFERNTWSIAEDRSGRIYVGTVLGARSHIDPASGNVLHYSTDDGLARGVIETSLTDEQGDLWFGSVEGLSRLTPGPESRTPPPPIRIAGVVVNGLSEPLPEIGAGAVRIAARTVEPASVEVRFVALDFAPGGRPRYQYRVDGIDRDWSAPTAQPSVVYARLPSGRYRFRVRGVSGGGVVGSSEAVVDFGVRPSFWRRPETIASAALLLVAIGFGLHRSRLKNALALERVRTRVASDLHDDVGSGLSEIAILSEVAGQGDGGGEPPARILREIGNAGESLVDSMGDIVWSTDPGKDDVASLVQRLRHFAANTLESRGIAWSLEVPDASRQDARPGPPPTDLPDPQGGAHERREARELPQRPRPHPTRSPGRPARDRGRRRGFRSGRGVRRERSRPGQHAGARAGRGRRVSVGRGSRLRNADPGARSTFALRRPCGSRATGADPRMPRTPMPNDGPIRVALVEDKRLIREGLGAILDRARGLACVGTYASAEEALRGLEDAPADVLLLDIQLPGISGIEAVNVLRGGFPIRRLSTLTVYEEEERVFEAIRNGACGSR